MTRKDNFVLESLLALWSSIEPSSVYYGENVSLIPEET